MKLESISVIEKARDKFKVIFEDGTPVTVSAAQIADFGLYSGRELTDEEFIKLQEQLEHSAARTRALRILGSRNMSSRELEKRLVQKGERIETAQDTAQWLENIGIVNDTEYAVMIVRHYCGKGYGEARIRDELYRRGIPRDMWDDALVEYEGAGSAAYTFLERRLRGSRDKGDIRRASDALYRRGFNSGEIHELIKMYLENADETEDDVE